MVKDNTLYTPEPRNILVGISRGHIFDMANELGIEYKEKNLTVDDAMQADEAFFTGTPFAMLPITSINGKLLNDGKKGPIFSKLISKWSAIVGIDIPEQIRDFNKEINTIEGSTPYQFKSKKL